MLPNNARCGVCRKEILLQGVGAPRRMNLTWADTPGERRATFPPRPLGVYQGVRLQRTFWTV